MSAIAAFESLQRAVESSCDDVDRLTLVDAFVRDRPESPLIGEDEAIIWYRGPGARVLLRGDMLQERSEPLA
jgi:hypothetical protein